MYKKEPCRYFLQGRCHFGARCKYSHATQPQQQQQNPYGFGARDSQQGKSGLIGSNIQNHQKVQMGKGNSLSHQSGTGSVGLQKPGSQSNVTIHKCDDPNGCKQQIIEDSTKENPLWKLTCYGHWKYLPCDITGDVSYEELRFAAYDDAARGVPLQQIVERERKLFASKVEEFNKLLHNPYTRASASNISGFNLSPAFTSGASPITFPSNTHALTSGASQFGNASIKPFSSSNVTVPRNSFPSVNGNASSNNPTQFQSCFSSFGNTVASQQSFPRQQNDSSAAFSFGVNNSTFQAGDAGNSNSQFGNPFGNANRMFNSTPFSAMTMPTTATSSLANQGLNSPGIFNMTGMSNSAGFGSSFSAMTGATSATPSLDNQGLNSPGIFNMAGTSSSIGFGSPFSAMTLTTSGTSSLGNQGLNSPRIFNTTGTSSGNGFGAIANTNSSSNLINTNSLAKDDIWLKESWTPEEIPEDEPPPYARY